LCGKKSAGIPEDFAAVYVSHEKFPANSNAADKAAGNVYLAEDFPAKYSRILFQRFLRKFRRYCCGFYCGF